MKYTINQDKLTTQFKNTRQRSEDICKPLVTEDYVPQPITDVSPPKWHLAHTTWFFEQFALLPHFKGYRIFDKQFSYLFNSYYNNMGDRSQRSERGFMTRPTVKHVYNYRKYVKDHMLQLLDSECPQEVLFLVEVGVNHEQQHQELLIYDIKYILGNQPTFPEYGSSYVLEKETHEKKWINIA
ncbi:MAG: DinB family protein, partial [Flavobacteriaceae bacterium]